MNRNTNMNNSISTSDWKKNIILFLVSQTISLFGSSLVQYAIFWYITLNTKSGVMMTISIICGFLPTFFLSPFAGVWADRFNRKTVIILSDLLIAASTLVMAVLFYLGFDSIILLFVMSAFRAAGTGIQTPAVGAFIPQLVPEDKLTKVNGYNGSIQSVIMLVSPMLSGVLMANTTIESIFMIDVFTAIAAVFVLLVFLRVPPHEKALNRLEKVSYFSDLREGIKYVNGHSYVKKFFTFCAFYLFLVTPAAFLTPLQVTRTFGDEVWRLTSIEIAFSLGMMLGGIFIATWSGFKNRVYTMALSSFVASICTIALGLIPVFWIYLVIMGTVGLFMPFFNTPSAVMLQEKVEPDFLGRVFGVMSMISSSMMPLGMLVFGPLADAVRIEILLVITGILIFGLSFFLLFSKDLVEAGKPRAADNMLAETTD